METGVILVLLGLTAFVQSAMGNFFDQPTFRLELLLLTAIFFSFSKGWKRGLFLGAVAGLLKDVYSLQALGFNMIVYGFLCGTAGVLHELFFVESMFVRGFFVVLACCVSSLLGLVNHMAFRQHALAFVVKTVFVSAMLNGLFSPIIFGFYGRIRNAIQKNLLFFYS